MPKKTTNLNLPIISSDDYQTTKVVDMIDDIEGDRESSAFNIIDNAVGQVNSDITAANNRITTLGSQITSVSEGLAAKQDKLTVNPEEEAYGELSKIKINGLTYRLKTGITDVDVALSPDSVNPVQNKVIFTALSNYVTAQEVSRMIEEAIRYGLEQKY